MNKSNKQGCKKDFKSHILETIPLRIKKLRESKKLTQEQLAELVDIHVANLSKIERGLYIPRLIIIERIARALDVNIAYLICETSDNINTGLTTELSTLLLQFKLPSIYKLCNYSKKKGVDSVFK